MHYGYSIPESTRISFQACVLCSYLEPVLNLRPVDEEAVWRGGGASGLDVLVPREPLVASFAVGAGLRGRGVDRRLELEAVAVAEPGREDEGRGLVVAEPVRPRSVVLVTVDPDHDVAEAQDLTCEEIS